MSEISPAYHQRNSEQREFRVPRVLLRNKPLAIFLISLTAFLIGLLTGKNGIAAIAFFVVPVIIWMFYNPAFAFYLFVASLPLYVVNVEMLSASIPRLVGIALFLVWLPYVFFTGKFKLIKWNKFLVLAVIFFCWMLLSVLWTMYPKIGVVRVRTISQLMLAMFIGITLIDKPRKYSWVVIVVIITGTLIGLRSFYMSLFTTERTVGIEGFDQNEFAAMLIIPLMVAFSLYNFHKNKPFQALLLFVMFACFLGALSTVSRGFVVSVATAFATLLILEPNKKKMIAVLVIAFLVSSPYFLKRYGDRVGSMEFEITKTYEAPIGRLGIWYIGVEIFKNYPIWGVGVGGFPVAFNEEIVKDPARIKFWKYGRAAHNDYLQILCELGIIGFILWMFFIVEVFRMAFRTKVILERLNETYLVAINRGLIAALVGLMVASMFLGLYSSKYMWMLFMLFLFLGYIAKRLKDQSSDPQILKIADS